MAPIIDIFAVPPLGCNCTIVGDSDSKRAVVVDPGGNVQVILKKLQDKGLTCDKILVTHGHLDHILGAEEIKEATGAPIVMHQDDLSLYQNVSGQCADFGVPLPKKPLPDPDVFVADNDVHEVAEGVKFKALHCPGHTPGSISYYFEDHNIVCAGDTLFESSIGRTSWDGLPSLQGTSDSQQIIASIKHKLYTLPNDVEVVCGHGGTTDIGTEKRGNPFTR
mmetsp:Transcript_35199/g.76953  ORF Transcript_35199/g.76953 Transcript_35199/m.76953 type:complete len:221 (-) Transcript_35199:401-1063(-)